VTISFDLDDTLIPGTKRFDTERQSLVHKILGLETLRIGTVELIIALQAKGHKIYIYTTSFRSPIKMPYNDGELAPAEFRRTKPKFQIAPESTVNLKIK